MWISLVGTISLDAYVALWEQECVTLCCERPATGYFQEEIS